MVDVDWRIRGGFGGFHRSVCEAAFDPELEPGGDANILGGHTCAPEPDYIYGSPVRCGTSQCQGRSPEPTPLETRRPISTLPNGKASPSSGSMHETSQDRRAQRKPHATRPPDRMAAIP